MKKALITGITGQDGSYLAEFLLEKGYEVHGIVRRSSSFNRERIDHLPKKKFNGTGNLVLHYGDLADGTSLSKILNEVSPDEVYNLAAQSHVGISFKQPEYTMDINANGPVRILERIKEMNKGVKFYQASTSEMFGKSPPPQNEETLFAPVSPYANAKLSAHNSGIVFRESYGLFVCNGILFNHESPRRGENFVTRKITKSLCEIKIGKKECLYLGNLDAKRDWGFAKDYVEAMWLMMQKDKPGDYVISTGETHSVREFVELVGRELGIQIHWRGSGIEEEGIDRKTGKSIIKVDPEYYRPIEVNNLKGDSTKAERLLGWKPKTSFNELVKIMVSADLDKARNDLKEPY